ncbi:MAG: hypothetical protein AB7E95_11315, partial [Kiritimatiellales bacterium]
MRKFGILIVAMAAGSLLANADITISYQNNNINNGVSAARTSVGINPDGSGYRDSGASYPGSDATYPAITGSVDSFFAGYIFSVGIGGGQFDNTTNSATFGVRNTKSLFTKSVDGVGLNTAAGEVDSRFKPLGAPFKLCRIGSGFLSVPPSPGREEKSRRQFDD